MSDLFNIETQINALAEQMAEKRVQEILSDPQKALEIYQARNKELETKVAFLEAEVKPKADKWERFLDASGLISCRDASQALKIKYYPPKGKQKIMGGDIFVKLLVFDGIIYNTVNGYSIKQEYFNRGYGETRETERNGIIVKSVQFTSKGLDWLTDKYNKDERIWGTKNGRLEELPMGLQSISRESKD